MKAFKIDMQQIDRELIANVCAGYNSDNAIIIAICDGDENDTAVFTTDLQDPQKIIRCCQEIIKAVRRKTGVRPGTESHPYLTLPAINIDIFDD